MTKPVQAFRIAVQHYQSADSAWQDRLSKSEAKKALQTLEQGAAGLPEQLAVVAETLKTANLTDGARAVFEGFIADKQDATAASTLIFQSKVDAFQSERSGWQGKLSKSEAQRALAALERPGVATEAKLQAVQDTLQSATLTPGARAELENYIESNKGNSTAQPTGSMSVMDLRLGGAAIAKPRSVRVGWELNAAWRTVDLVQAWRSDAGASGSLSAGDARQDIVDKFRAVEPDLKNFIRHGSSSLSGYEMQCLAEALDLHDTSNSSARFRRGDRVAFESAGQPQRGLVLATYPTKIKVLGLDADGNYKVFRSDRVPMENMKVLASANQD